MRRCGATSACSATCSAGSSSSRRTSRCSRTSSGCAALARACAGRRAARRARGGGRRRCRSSARRACCARSRSTSSSRTSPSSSTAIRRRRAYELEERVPARVARRLVRAARRRAAEELERRVSLAARADRASDRGDAAHRARLAPAHRGAARRARRPAARSVRRDEIEDELAAEITALWQTDEVRSRRPRVVDEIRNGHWFFEQSLIDAAERLLADYRRHLPGRAAAASLRHVDRRRRRRQPERGRRDDRARRSSARARCCATGTATRCARSRPTIGVSSRLTPVDDGAARVDRARRARAAGVRRGDRRPEPRRAVPAQALVHVAAARRRRV